MGRINPKAIVAALGVVSLFIVLISIAILIYGIIVWWKLLQKSGDKGWKVLIPIYGQFCMFRAVGSVWYFWLLILTIILNTINNRLFMSFTISRTMYSFLDIILTIGNIIMSIFLAIRTAKSFRKSGGFAVGLFFLPLIFRSILAFGSAKHINSTEEEPEEYRTF